MEKLAIFNIYTLTPFIGQVEAFTGSAQTGTWTWIVNVMTAVVGALLFFQLKDIKQVLSELLRMVHNHETRVTVLEKQVERIEEKEEDE